MNDKSERLSPVDVKYSASRITKYQPCTIDLRPIRVVHYPDLNACLINEKRLNNNKTNIDNNFKAKEEVKKNIDCRAVHFGYAIPVSVLPLENKPEFAELVLDTESELSSGAKKYLLQHHPVLRDMQKTNENSNATNVADDDDIAAIAKQISDHAEAIYQTWKSRGLGPTELLTICQPNSGAFSPVLSPTKSPIETKSAAKTSLNSISNTNKPVREVPNVSLLNTSQLEHLVTSFVEEDKARNKIRPSSDNSRISKTTSKKTTSPVFSQTPDVSGLTTWPLKNHLPTNKIKKKEEIRTISVLDSSTQEQPPISSRSKYATLPSKKNNVNNAFLEEVAREEERLINALKTGCVVDDTDKKSIGNPNVPGLSRIDYAKIRFQAAQENPLTRQRLENAREIEEQRKELLLQQQHSNHTANSLVSETRNRFETLPNDTCSSSAWKTSEWLPSKYSVDSTGGLVDNTSLLLPVNIRNRSKYARKSRDLDVDVPHPQLTNQQKQHIKERVGATSSGLNPIRPFLTRGSVAERVLLFEKCPPSDLLSPFIEKRKSLPAITTWRSGNEVQNKTQTYTQRDGSNRICSTSFRSPSSHPAPIPRFHFPRGQPTPVHENEAAKQAVIALFKNLPAGKAFKENYANITKTCGLPLYWKLPFFIASVGDNPNACIHLQSFLDFWTKFSSIGNDEAVRLVWLLTKGQRSWLTAEDLVPLIQDVVDTHPGLSFLKEATEFHSRYVHTVIARMFYCANRSWSGRLSIPEIRRSQILPAIRQLENTSDINQITQFFSYEHFYVIYCKFWELDRDHDLLIDRSDLSRHNEHALSSRIIDRIFSGAVTRCKGRTKKGEERMTYTEFVWFLLSEEDKTHPTAIEYWFRCMDLDGDGFLSMYELEYFYEEQLQRMEALGMETLPFEDCLCQMLDMISPSVQGKISLRDLKRCKLTPLFFDTFFNLEKFLDHEQRDPFATQPRETAPDGSEMSDWDRYAAEEYELLVAEESGAEPVDEMILYDELSSDDDVYDDENQNEDALSPNLDQLEELHTPRNINNDNDNQMWVANEADEDSGDYAGDSDDYSF